MDDDGVAVAFTNVRPVANLVVNKTTTGGTGTFTFVVDCPGTEFDRTLTIENTGSATVEGIPIPTTCTVTENVHPDFDSTPGRPQGVLVDDDSGSVAFTNVAIPREEPPTLEGCTPGYWKNHPEAWQGYSPNATLEDVFDVPNNLRLETVKLLAALDFEGGGTAGAARILLRAAVAALLNAAHDDVNYPRTTQQIVNDVNTALASGNRATMLQLAEALDRDNSRRPGFLFERLSAQRPTQLDPRPALKSALKVGAGLPIHLLTHQEVRSGPFSAVCARGRARGTHRRRHGWNIG